MVTRLTAKQKMILDFLKSEIRKHGYPPTVREICEAVGLSSTSTVHAHLETLERKGYIRRSPTKNRSTEILEEDFYSNTRAIVNVPIVKAVSKDAQILAEDNIEDTFPIPIDYVKNGDCFMMYARENVTSEGILEGDLVLVQKQQDASYGDIVIAIVNDLACIKKYHKDENSARLTHSNEGDSLPEADFIIIGKIIGLYRRY